MREAIAMSPKTGRNLIQNKKTKKYELDYTKNNPSRTKPRRNKASNITMTSSVG